MPSRRDRSFSGTARPSTRAWATGWWGRVCPPAAVLGEGPDEEQPEEAIAEARARGRPPPANAAGSHRGGSRGRVARPPRSRAPGMPRRRADDCFACGRQKPSASPARPATAMCAGTPSDSPRWRQYEGRAIVQDQEHGQERIDRVVSRGTQVRQDPEARRKDGSGEPRGSRRSRSARRRTARGRGSWMLEGPSRVREATGSGMRPGGKRHLQHEGVLAAQKRLDDRLTVRARRPREPSGEVPHRNVAQLRVILQLSRDGEGRRQSRFRSAERPVERDLEGGVPVLVRPDERHGRSQGAADQEEPEDDEHHDDGRPAPATTPASGSAGVVEEGSRDATKDGTRVDVMNHQRWRGAPAAL